MTMYKKAQWGWAIMRQVGGKWVQQGAAVGMSIETATGQQLDKVQIRLLRKRDVVLINN